MAGRLKIYERYQNGALIERVETPYTADDYLADIAVLEAEITPRRQREALLTVEGKAWLFEQERKINLIREEMYNGR